MSNGRRQESGTDTLIKLGAIGVGLYLIYKMLSPPQPDAQNSKELFRCGNCGGAIVGRPKNCAWCHVQIDWSNL